MSATTTPGLLAPARRSRSLRVASAAALLACATLLLLNYCYVSTTVNLDDEVNPYLVWAPWSGLAVVVGGTLGIVAVALALTGTVRRHGSLADRLAAAITLLGSVGVLYVRYEIKP